MKDKIKTADQILQQALNEAYTVQELEKGIIEPHFIQNAMIKYAKQFINLAAEKATTMDDPNSYTGNTGSEYPADIIVNKESILEIKQLIK